MPQSLRWDVAEPRLAVRDGVAAALGVEPITAQILVNRGHDDAEQARRFLDASLASLADPDLIVDVAPAAARVVRALVEGEPITVYGDYDADGVTATSILLRGLSALGGKVAFYIPSRFTEGYGLNHAALKRIALGGGRLVIAVDCGVTAVDEITQARDRGQEIVVVDHHEPAANLPPALVIIDPKRRDRPSPFREYSAAGLALQLLRAVRTRVGRSEVPEELLELAALGTIADIVPLTDDNRILARWGLARMRSTGNVGLAALIRASGLSGEITARHVGFALAPRLNAAGRLGDAAVAVKLLTTHDLAEAEAIAARLDEANQQRRTLCDQILADAIDQVEAAKLQEAPAIVLASERWHAGVIGIVASQLVERYYRPVVLMVVDRGVGKGSARSIAPFNLFEALTACGDLLIRYGGHAMAAGLTIAAERIPDFARRFAEVAGGRLALRDLVPSITIDAEVPLSAVTAALARQLQQLAPFGAGNPEPVLAARGLVAVASRVMGDGLHLRLGVTDGRGYAEAVGFRLGDASELLAFTRARVDLAFTVALEQWEDSERVQLVLRDLQTPTVELDEVLTDTQVLVERLFARSSDYLGDGALGLEEADAFYTKVVGVSFEGRQDFIRTLTSGSPLLLRREPDNPHDPHAIKVTTASGEQIGYLSARVAARLAPSIDSGARYTTTVSQVTGGGERHQGVNVYLQRHEGPADELDPSTFLRLAWQDLPTDDLIERVRVHLLRGRYLRAPQLEAVRAVLGGRSVLGVFGPGRGRFAVMALIVASEVIAGRGPVVIAVPLPVQAERWHDRLAPRLQRIGVTCIHVHGALTFRQHQRLLRTLHRGGAEVIISSLQYLQHKGEALRPALLLFDCEPTIDADTVEQVLQALGHPRWAAFSATLEDDVRALRQRGALEPVIDVYLRTNLRLVDRRESAERDGVLREILGREEKTMICVGTRAGAVEMASRLRDQAPGQVAYYHGGLPMRVREVLEQMYVDGKIGALVVADGFGEEAAPADLRQVAVAGLPSHRSELIEHVGMAGLDGRQATITLLFGHEDIRAVEANQAEQHPTRELLAALYRSLRSEVERAGAATWPDDGLATGLEAVMSHRTIGIGLDVLAEAGVIQREFDGDRWRITLAGDEARRDLMASLRYLEGQQEARAVASLAQWAFGPLAEILRPVAGPSAS